MPVILSNYILAVQLPESRVVIRTRGDQVRGVGAERAIPDPPLMAVECGFEWEGVDVAFRGESILWLRIVRLRGVDGPDPSCVVGGTGGEVADIGREEDAGYVGVVGDEFAYRDDGGYVAALDHAPDVYIARIISCA